MTIAITFSIIFRTWALTSTCFPTIRLASVIALLTLRPHSLLAEPLTSESLQPNPHPQAGIGKLLHGRPDTPRPQPLSNPKGLDSLLGIPRLAISGTNKGVSILELAVPK